MWVLEALNTGRGSEESERERECEKCERGREREKEEARNGKSKIDCQSGQDTGAIRLQLVVPPTRD